MTKKKTTTTTTTETKLTKPKTKIAIATSKKNNITAKTREIKGKSLHELIGKKLIKLREKTEFIEIESEFEKLCNKHMFLIKPCSGIKINFATPDLKDIMGICYTYNFIPMITKEIFEIWKKENTVNQSKNT